MNFKYIISNRTDPYYNIALEECLFPYADKNTVILYLWQNDNTIVIGKNQNVYSECRVLDFLKQNGNIARRKSGGGAVYHDMGNLNFSIISAMIKDEKILYRNLILKVMKSLGMQAEFSGRNDLLINGRKFSGNAVYHKGDLQCQHGTVLIHSDIEKMAYYLTPEKSKMERHHVQSISSRVINLVELSPKLTVETVMQSFIRETKAQSLSVLINQMDIEKAAEFYNSEKWIYGGTI